MRGGFNARPSQAHAWPPFAAWAPVSLRTHTGRAVRRHACCLVLASGGAGWHRSGSRYAGTRAPIPAVPQWPFMAANNSHSVPLDRTPLAPRPSCPSCARRPHGWPQGGCYSTQRGTPMQSHDASKWGRWLRQGLHAEPVFVKHDRAIPGRARSKHAGHLHASPTWERAVTVTGGF